MEQFDVIVIGSGFGGAVAACRLSQAGFSVLLLERGRRYEANDFPALPDDDRLLPELRRWVYSQDQGLWDLQDLGEIIAVQAAGYGGGSLIYANVHLRPPEGTFDKLGYDDAGRSYALWPTKFHGASLEPYFDLAAHMLNVAPISDHPSQPFPKTKNLDQVTIHLGREILQPPLAINYEAKAETDTSEPQNACTGCGKCCTGCPERAKSSLDLNYLAVAERNGTRVRTQCEVVGIEQKNVILAPKNRWEVTYVNHLTASRDTVSAKSVFLCAGVVGSTRLLHDATLQPANEALKKRIGLGYFPNADAAGMVYETSKDCSPSSGPAITTSTVHWQDNHFFMIQDGGYAPELERLLGILRAPLWAGRNRAHAAAPRPRRASDSARTPAEFAGVALVSPLDGVLDAVAGGALTNLSPPKLAQSGPSFLRELERPLLLPSVVDATIERTMRARYARSFLARFVPYDSWLVTAVRRLFKRIVLALAGGTKELGDQALRSVLKGGDLNRNAYAREVLGYDGSGAKRRMLLLAMGQDAAPGALVFDEDSRSFVADLDLYHLFSGYTNQELLMKDIARGLGGELRLNPLWSFYGKPITVHSQGGCRMSEVPEDGVTRPDGQVHGCPGLYVLDGSILCQSVGVNPTPSILAIAERNVLDFIRAERAAPSWPDADKSAGAAEYRAHLAGAKSWRKKAEQAGWALRPRPTEFVPLASQPLGLKFKEQFHGYCAPLSRSAPPAAPTTEAEYRLLETAGRPDCPFELDLEVSCRDLYKFFEDLTHRLELAGTLKYSLPGQLNQEQPVTGFLELLVPRHKRYGLDPTLVATQKRIAGSYTTVKGLPQPGEERVMYYNLSLPGDELRLKGYKLIRQDPGIDAWRDTTALFTAFGRSKVEHGKKVPLEKDDAIEIVAAGAIHVDLSSFMYREVPSFEAIGGEERIRHRLPGLEVTGTSDAARIHWALGKFASFFFGTLQRVYSPAARSVANAIYEPLPNGVRHERPSVGA